jgi:hypothetical protein
MEAVDIIKNMGLVDLQPVTGTLRLNGKEYKVNKYSLKYKAHFMKKYGIDRITAMCAGYDKEITQDLFFAEVAYTLLEDRADFPEFDNFIDAFASTEEYRQLHDVIIAVLGLKSGLTRAETAQAEKEREDKKKAKKKKKKKRK